MNNFSLFDDIGAIPSTEGIKYAGSKLKFIPHILDLTRRTGAKTVLDGFSGSTRVSQAFAQSGYNVISNDIAVWSEILGTCYLLNREPREYYFKLIQHLNNVSPKDGWFTEYYGGEPNGGVALQSDGLKKPWQVHNTRKLDAILEEIDRLSLSPIEKTVALTSLILALDRVDNTLGHFVSYLKNWSARSYNHLYLKVPKLFSCSTDCEVICGDVFDVIDRKVDLAYLDPPYGSNNEKMPPSRVRYASYYHLWTTICLNDLPELFGKAGRRIDSSDTIAGSIFEEFRQNPDTGRFFAVEAIERLIKSTQARWVLLSYSSGGRATSHELNDILSSSGDVVDVIEVNYKRNVMAEMKWTNDWLRDTEYPNTEFLFLIDTG